MPKLPSSAPVAYCSRPLSDPTQTRSPTANVSTTNRTAVAVCAAPNISPSPHTDSDIPSPPAHRAPHTTSIQQCGAHSTSAHSYDRALQPLRASVEGEFTSIRDTNEFIDTADMQASPPAASGCLRVPSSSHPQLSTAQSMSSAIASLRRMSSKRNSIRSSARSLPGRETPALDPPPLVKSPTRSPHDNPARNCGSQDNQSPNLTGRSVSASPTRKSAKSRFTSWLSQTVGAVRSLGRGRSRDSRPTPLSTRRFATRDSFTIESSVDILNTLNMLQGNSCVGESMSVADSVQGTRGARVPRPDSAAYGAVHADASKQHHVQGACYTPVGSSYPACGGGLF